MRFYTSFSVQVLQNTWDLIASAILKIIFCSFGLSIIVWDVVKYKHTYVEKHKVNNGNVAKYTCDLFLFKQYMYEATGMFIQKCIPKGKS